MPQSGSSSILNHVIGYLESLDDIQDVDCTDEYDTGFDLVVRLTPAGHQRFMVSQARGVVKEDVPTDELLEYGSQAYSVQDYDAARVIGAELKRRDVSIPWGPDR